MKNNNIQWENLAASCLRQDEKLVKEWDRLNASGGDCPFLAGDVTVSAVTILGDGKERLLVGSEGSKVVAMFLLCRQGSLRWQTFQPSQLPLGAWVAEPRFALDDLARSLMRGPIGICLGISITQVDPRVAKRDSDAPDSHSTDYIDTGWIDILGSFDDYWAARGKKFRSNMRKQRTKLQKEGIQLSMKVLHAYDDMAPAVAQYGALESSGWKAENGTAIHPENAQGKYYRELLEQASRRGEALVYQYFFGDRVVAMNLCLARNGTLIVLKTTYDETIQGYSPAFLLREAELQELHAEGSIKHLEYFGRLMEWHTKWTDNRRTLYHLTLYRWPFLKKLAEARHKKKAVLQSAKVDHAATAAEAE
jgi:hypothetical protein